MTPSAPADTSASSQPMLAFVNFELRRQQQELHEEIAQPKPPERPWNFFSGPTGGTGKVNTQGKQLGAHYWDVGALAGFDYAFSQVGVGLLVDFDRTHVDVEQNWGHYHFEHFHSSFFATYAPHILPQLAFNGVVGGAYDWYDIRRNTKTNGVAKGHTRGSELDALFATEYVFSGEQFSTLPKKLELTPRAFLQYIYVDIGKFTERDAGSANVHLHSQFGKSLRTGLDLWGQYNWDWKRFSFALEADIGWQREYFDQGQSIHFTPVGVKGPTTPISTHGAGRDTLTAGVDCFFQFFKKYGVELSYDFQFNHLFYDHAFYLGCEVRY
jgi:outer membrane autotransporter protein